jgi:hypothetical protein
MGTQQSWTGLYSDGHYWQIAAWGSREKRVGWEQRSALPLPQPHHLTALQPIERFDQCELPSINLLWSISSSVKKYLSHYMFNIYLRSRPSIVWGWQND